MRTPPRVMPALVTPFTDDGELDLESHRHNLRTLAAEGINGFLIAGSTGEGAYLEPGEREELIRAARDELGRRPFLLGGVVAETERAARAQLAEVEAGGADGALVITPTTLVRNRHPLVKRFYIDLADDAPIPLLLYSVPSYTAYPLPTEVAVELSAHPAIVGMKDSGGDPVRMGDLVAGCADGFFLFCGSSAALSQAVAAGAYGAITASANYAPALVAEVVKRRRPGPWQRRLTGMSRGIEVHGVPGVKAAAAAFGLHPGFPRLPLRPVTRRDAAGLAALVAEG
jgi:dihydrodipicolinate synthase/N-acetylneuraminate lyase